MPEFSASPVVELYNPANVIGVVIGSASYEVIKGSFSEEVVEIPATIYNAPPKYQQMYEFHTYVWGENRDELIPVRMIGQSSTITAMQIDDLHNTQT